MIEILGFLLQPESMQCIFQVHCTLAVNWISRFQITRQSELNELTIPKFKLTARKTKKMSLYFYTL